MTRRLLTRLGLLAALLLTVSLLLPDSTVQRDEVVLVKTARADGVDVHPDVIWILAVGSDARLGQSMTRSRGDALQLVGLNTRTGAATAIGVPRDSWVPIPGHGSEKINASLYFGGPQLLAQSIGNLVGITPDYVMVTRFQFFSEMVNSIGGITVRNPRPFSDQYLKVKGFREGAIHLNGYDAMAFSRIRHNLAGGDFDRSANQQRVLRGIQARIAQRADRPGFLERGVLTVLKNTSTDLRPADLFRIATAISQVDPRKVTTCVVPGGVGNVGAQSVVFPDVAKARAYGDAARRDATLSGC